MMSLCEFGPRIAGSGKYGENLVTVAKLMKHIDFRGLRRLDLGTVCGKMAFLMEKLGADVTAADTVPRSELPKLIEMFGSEVQARFGIFYQNLPEVRRDEGPFDFILCSGVLYHIHSLLDCIFHVRAAVERDG